MGANLFSSWRDQTEEEHRRIWNEIGLDDFEDVKPYFHPRSDQASDAAPHDTETPF